MTSVLEFTVTDSATVETVGQLHDALSAIADGLHDLDSTYVVERLEEKLSDGSIAVSIRIRLAERA